MRNSAQPGITSIFKNQPLGFFQISLFFLNPSTLEVAVFPLRWHFGQLLLTGPRGFQELKVDYRFPPGKKEQLKVSKIRGLDLMILSFQGCSDFDYPQKARLRRMLPRILLVFLASVAPKKKI